MIRIGRIHAGVGLKEWHGGVAKVLLGGRTAGYVGFAPWRCAVTELVRVPRDA